MVNPTFKVALETGTDYSDTAMLHIWHIEEFAKLMRYGLPAFGIRIENYDGEDEWCLKSDLIQFMKENDIHPDWMKESV